MANSPERLLFLPGATGGRLFWHALASRLQHPAEKRIVGYPGFDGLPPDPAVKGIDDLVDQVVAQIDRPTALVAQSMGGVLAIRAALACPALVTHLVLTVTSAGIDTTDVETVDWRPGFREVYPQLPDWLLTFNTDFTPDLSRITMPVLLLWGDSDPISPVALGERLKTLLPNAVLRVVAGGRHDLANAHADEVAAYVDSHLG